MPAAQQCIPLQPRLMFRKGDIQGLHNRLQYGFYIGYCQLRA